MDTNIKKFRFRLNIKILASHIIGTAALLAFVYIAISYSRGDFELPFYDRDKAAPQLEHEIILPDRESEIPTAEQSTEDLTDILDVVNPDDLVEPPGDEAEYSYAETTESAFAFELFSSDMARRGFAVSDGIYEAFDEAKANAEIAAYKAELKKVLDLVAEAGEEEEPPELPAEPVIYEYKFAQITPAVELPKSRITSISYGDNRISVEPFMDYIIIRDTQGEILCDAMGKVITRDFGIMDLEILKMRDELNRTVFKTGGTYWIYDPVGGENGSPAFVQIQFNELFGDRGVPFMYPSYYGAYGASGLDRTYNSYNRKWGYAAAGTQNFVISRIYLDAFNFNENIGIAYQESPGRGNKLSFLDIYGNNYLNTSHNYYAPDVATANHLGFFYFDHWLTRVYEREFDMRGNAIVERELIVNYYGTPFYIPEDYTIKAYSNGMILLEKNGYYGFMNYLGEWVGNPIYTYAQPFFEGVAVIGLSNGKKALIDTKGNLLTKFTYDAISNCTGGIIALFERDRGWTIVNKVRRQLEIN